MTAPLLFLPTTGWAVQGRVRDEIVFDPRVRVPVEGAAIMDEIARMTSKIESGRAFHHWLLQESGAETIRERLLTIGVLRLLCEFSPGHSMSERYGGLIMLDRSVLESLWAVLRVLMAREAALLAARGQAGPVDLDSVRERVGNLITDPLQAMRVAEELGPADAVALYEGLARALENAVTTDLTVESENWSDMPAIGPLRLTEHQAQAVRPILERFRELRGLCRHPLRWGDHVTWREDDRRWQLVDRTDIWPRVMAMAGAAGVGKSYTLVYLVLRMMQLDPTLTMVALTAYTHSAASVVEVYFEKLFSRLKQHPDLNLGIADAVLDVRSGGVGTRVLCWRLVVDGVVRHISRPRTLMSMYHTKVGLRPADVLNEAAGEQTLGYQSDWHIGINDESSLLSHSLLRFLVGNAPHPLLLVGDPGQLPPINENEGRGPAGAKPDAFSELVAAGFAQRIGAFANLMDAPNMRTDDASSGILRLAHSIRRHINLPPTFKAADRLLVDRRPLRTLEERCLEAAADPEQPGVGSLTAQEAVRLYAANYWDAKKNPTSHGLIIAGTHEQRTALNADVRRALRFGTNPAPNRGETLIVESGRRVTVGEDDPLLTGHDRRSRLSLANNEFFTIVDVLEADVDVVVDFRRGYSRGAYLEQRTLMSSARAEAGHEEDPDENPQDVHRGTIKCAHCRVRVATGAIADVYIPHAALKDSPRVRKVWTDSYMRVYEKLLKGATVLTAEVFGRPLKTHTYATLALFSRDRELHVLRSDGTRAVRTFAQMRIPERWVFPDHLRLHWCVARHRPFLLSHVLQAIESGIDAGLYGRREFLIAREVQAWARSSFVMAHFAYCVTGHASQGTQFKNVYALLEPPAAYRFSSSARTIAERSLQDILRWLYVVITRAEEQLWIIGSRLADLDREPATSVDPMRGWQEVGPSTHGESELAPEAPATSVQAVADLTDEDAERLYD